MTSIQDQESDHKALIAVRELKIAAKNALTVLKFAKPTEKRNKVVKELQDTLHECRDSLFDLDNGV